MSDEKFVIPKNNSLFVSDDLLSVKQDIENQLQDQSLDDELGMISCTIKSKDDILVGFLKSTSFTKNKLSVEVSVVANLAIQLMKKLKHESSKVQISFEEFDFVGDVSKIKITNIANQVCTLKLMFEWV